MQVTEIFPAQAGRTHVRASFLRLLTRALGVSFLSLISLGLALFAYLNMPQVQDLFFDVRPYWYQGALYWFWFYIVGLMFWALPLVFTARLLLQQNYQNIGVDSQSRYTFFVLDFPKYFVIAAFLIVLAGIYVAASNLPSDTGTSAAETVLREYLTRHILLLFGFTAFFAVFLIYRGAFVRQYFRFMERFEKRRPKTFRTLLIGFETLASRHSSDLRSMSFHLEELKPDFIDRETYIAGQRGKVFMVLYLLVISAVTLTLIALHFLSYSTLIGSLLSPMTMASWPAWLRNAVLYLSDTLWLQRAALMPMLFGAWLPFMALLALLSNRFQFPFIVTLIAVAIGLTLFVSDGHDARVATLPQDAAKAPAAVQRVAALTPSPVPATLALEKAVALWKTNNGWAAKGCDSEDPGLRENCPRPIIVAGEGGGSRAAFFLAAALGHLQDRSLDTRERKGAQRLRRFSDQLFAISSVSGSSAGAAFFVSALQAHPLTPGPQLARSLFRQRLWFQNVARPNRDFLGDFVTYKDALQAAFSIDYLSPVLVGYLARDVTTFSRLPFVLDRAGVLETTWENSFGRIYGWRTGSLLTAPFLQFTPTEEKWSPVLLFNATSVETGRRVIATPLSADDRPGGKYIFSQSYDLYELFCADRTIEDLAFFDRIASFLPRIYSPVAGVECRDKRPEGIDIRLSTAANLGARFPLVAPHANIRDTLGNVSDSLVDGGYFDNSGAVTALEVASALKRVDPKLEPLIIQISSEPEWFPNLCVSTVEARNIAVRPQVPDEADFKPLGTVGSLLTVNATRIARGYQTISELPEQMFQLNGKPSHELLYVCPQARENIIASFLSGQLGPRSARREEPTEAWKNVSLSWWLSPPLQAYLDAQLYSAQNQAAIDRILALLRE